MGDLTSVVLKWLRAREHLETVEKAIQAYAKSNPCPTVSDADPNTGEKIWRVVGEPNRPPQLLNPFIGDALQNYRSALDHLAWQLVIEGGVREPDEMTVFPICDSVHTFKSQAGTCLDGMTKPMKAAIEGLQPCYRLYPSRDPIFWALQRLNNVDKHRHDVYSHGAY